VRAVRKICVLLLLLCGVASAHVGSPDVFFQGNAGPYPLLVTIRPPDVIPGVAQIEVRSLAQGVEKIELTPTPMTGIASTHPPVADPAERMAGVEVESLIVNVTGGRIGSNHYGAHVPIAARAVTEADIHRVLEIAASSTARQGRAVIHSLPTGFSLDSTVMSVVPINEKSRS